jgi:hypothetical protein
MMFPLVRELALEGIPVTLSCRVGEQSVFPARGITPGGRARCVTGIGVMRT